MAEGDKNKGRLTFMTFGFAWSSQPMYTVMHSLTEDEIQRFLVKMYHQGPQWADPSDLTKIEITSITLKHLVDGMDDTMIKEIDKELIRKLCVIYGILKDVTSKITDKIAAEALRYWSEE